MISEGLATLQPNLVTGTRLYVKTSWRQYILMFAKIQGRHRVVIVGLSLYRTIKNDAVQD